MSEPSTMSGYRAVPMNKTLGNLTLDMNIDSRYGPITGEGSRRNQDLAARYTKGTHSIAMQATNQLKEGRASLSRRERMILVLTQKLGSSHSSGTREEDETQWYCKRFLGAGGYGVASLWVRLDGQGNETESLVMKTEEARPSRCVNLRRHDISKEAFFHASANQRGATTIPQLYDFKFIDSTVGFSDRKGKYCEYRYYMENCPNETIDSLAMNYRSWGYYLPEAFVWWVFHNLASALASLTAQPPTVDSYLQHTVRGFGQERLKTFMSHNDLKNVNIFVSAPNQTRERGQQPYSGYPESKVGDYGLAEVLENERESKSNFELGGTRQWNAPEKIDEERFLDNEWLPFLDNYNQRPIKDDEDAEKMWERNCATPASDIFSVGLIMFCLLTNRMISDVHQDLLNSMADACDNGAHQLEAFDSLVTKLRTETDEEDYSSDLRNLILDCLDLTPWERPTAEHLVGQTEAGMKMESERLNQVYGPDWNYAKQKATRVNFDKYVWNATCRGPFNFGIRMPSDPNFRRGISAKPEQDLKLYHWSYFFHDQKYADPNVPVLIPPTAYREEASKKRDADGTVKTTYRYRIRHAGYTVPEKESFDTPYPLWVSNELPRGGRALERLDGGHLVDNDIQEYRNWANLNSASLTALNKLQADQAWCGYCRSLGRPDVWLEGKIEAHRLSGFYELYPGSLRTVLMNRYQ